MKNENEELTGDMAAEQPDFEQQFEQLDEIVKKMEASDTTLSESFESYKEGIKLVQSLNSIIDGMEKEVAVLAGDMEEEE